MNTAKKGCSERKNNEMVRCIFAKCKNVYKEKEEGSR